MTSIGAKNNVNAKRIPMQKVQNQNEFHPSRELEEIMRQWIKNDFFFAFTELKWKMSAINITICLNNSFIPVIFLNETNKSLWMYVCVNSCAISHLVSFSILQFWNARNHLVSMVCQLGKYIWHIGLMSLMGLVLENTNRNENNIFVPVKNQRKRKRAVKCSRVTGYSCCHICIFFY